ncbi:hypothetical protein [Falsiroseomonas sp. E2-1-a20]|uniref:hypothetical protein n=1 Tax=Falsiroseomonas sp. E2-1-a20 TaxID=3239300 RepID=UPI003F40AC4D
MADIRADAQWLTYEELGLVLGIDPDSANRRARRAKWPRQRGNDGKTRVAVPPDVRPQSAPDIEETSRPRRPPANPGGTSGHVPADGNSIVKALEAEAALLREALARERDRADRAEEAAASLPDLRERTGRAEGEAEGLRAALRTAEAQAATLQADVIRERGTAQTLLQAEAAERQAAEMAREELAAWTAGGPLARMARAFFRRR